jgi:hypothetical protein
MDQIVGAAPRLPDNERKDLAILALARSATITDLAIGRGVSRKFVYAQTQKARVPRPPDSLVRPGIAVA